MPERRHKKGAPMTPLFSPRAENARPVLSDGRTWSHYPFGADCSSEWWRRNSGPWPEFINGYHFSRFTEFLFRWRNQYPLRLALTQNQQGGCFGFIQGSDHFSVLIRRPYVFIVDAQNKIAWLQASFAGRGRSLCHLNRTFHTQTLQIRGRNSRRLQRTRRWLCR